MILQTLDIKNNCKGIFHNGKFVLEEVENIINNYSVAWKHSPMLNDENFCYLYLSVKDEDLSIFSQAPDLFETYKNKMQAHKKHLRMSTKLQENPVIMTFYIRPMFLPPT